MVIIVDVGAVTDAKAANTMESDKFSLNIKYVRINIMTDADNDSIAAITRDFIPFFLNAENWKYSPIQKEISASEISAKKSVPVITLLGIMFMKKGPIKIPMIMYAETLGRPISFVILVVR
jgi:hypothetical protein